MIDASLLYYVPIALLCAFLFLAFHSRKFAFAVLRKNAESPDRTPVPWGLEIAFALIIFFAILTPLIFGRLCQGTSRFFSIQTTSNYEATVNVQESDNVSPSLSENPKTEQVKNIQEENRDISNKRQQEVAKQHPMARLLLQTLNQRCFYIILAIFLFSAVFLAPLVEEFVFRVVLQGACEKKFINSDAPTKGQIIGAITFPALIFAFLHIGSTGNIVVDDNLGKLLDGAFTQIAANFTTLVVGSLFIIKIFIPTKEQLGLPFQNNNVRAYIKEALNDIYRGAIIFFYIAPILYPINIILQKLGLLMFAAPISIFLFALCQGWVYYKTRRYLIVAGMHIALNFISLLFVCIWAATSIAK